MINLETIREKLEKLLNGTDSEIGDLISPSSDKYFFSVATEGFELKNIYDMKSGKNFIPVFIGSAGGEFNAIPNLDEYSLSIQCQVYFPVRFKTDFYTYFTDFIKKVFVGKILTYKGEKALSNISVPQYGEIDTFAVKEFKNFVVNTYKMPIEVSEQWMSMSFVLYLSSVASSFVYGNTIKTKMVYKDKETNPIYARESIGANIQTESEQILGTKEAKSIGVISAYALSVNVYVEKNDFFEILLNDYFNGQIQNEKIQIQNELWFGSFSDDYIISSANLNIEKGETLTLSLQLVKRKV